jgi:hypothetical protein
MGIRQWACVNNQRDWYEFHRDFSLAQANTHGNFVLRRMFQFRRLQHSCPSTRNKVLRDVISIAIAKDGWTVNVLTIYAIKDSDGLAVGAGTTTHDLKADLPFSWAEAQPQRKKTRSRERELIHRDRGGEMAVYARLQSVVGADSVSRAAHA